MTMRKGRRAVAAFTDPQATDQGNSNGRPIERPESIDQAQRWDVQRSRAAAYGLCPVCASQYAWGLQIGFSHSHPPCDDCAVIIVAAIGEVRPNGWKNLRLRSVGPLPPPRAPHAHRSRELTPARYTAGYGECCCGAYWTGFGTAHCAGCHQTFVSERAFARHRLRGRCCDPEARGLAKIAHAHWVGWGGRRSATASSATPVSPWPWRRGDPCLGAGATD